MRRGLQVSSPSGELWARSARRISCAAWRSDSERCESSPSADTVPRTIRSRGRRGDGAAGSSTWAGGKTNTRAERCSMTFEWHAPVRLGVRVAHRDNEAS
jgi:hypothetical protein